MLQTICSTVCKASRLNASPANLSRAKLLPTIEHTRGRDVLWCHPAFANRCAYVHNGQELLCVSLAATNGTVRIAPGA